MQMKLIGLLATGIVAASASSNVGWKFVGPSTYAMRGGDDPMHPSLTAAGAAQDIKAGANGTWFLGSVNGGVWRTTSIDATNPTWVNVLDHQPITCQSIAALHVSSYNPSRVWAGCGGSTSSMNGDGYNVMNSGEWTGVMSSNDNGNTWSRMESFPNNYYITDILETDSTGSLLVAAQSNLYNSTDGGIWLSTQESSTFTRVLSQPTFTLTVSSDSIFATHPRDPKHSVSSSTDNGKTWHDITNNMPWSAEAIPFYTCATVLTNGQVVVAGLTRSPGLPNNTNSQFFVATTGKSGNAWIELNQPTSMDEDAMPKDRMAILGDPKVANLMYVAGNAGALAWRVDVETGKWTQMWDKPDVLDGSIPHGDCKFKSVP